MDPRLVAPALKVQHAAQVACLVGVEELRRGLVGLDALEGEGDCAANRLVVPVDADEVGDILVAKLAAARVPVVGGCDEAVVQGDVVLTCSVVRCAQNGDGLLESKMSGWSVRSDRLEGSARRCRRTSSRLVGDEL